MVIVGGALVGSAAACFLAQEPGSGGSVLVLERDCSYRDCATTRSLASIRHQFPTPENVRLSMFGTQFLRQAPQRLAVALGARVGQAEVARVVVEPGRVAGVQLADGERIDCGWLINAAGKGATASCAAWRRPSTKTRKLTTSGCRWRSSRRSAGLRSRTACPASRPPACAAPGPATTT